MLNQPLLLLATAATLCCATACTSSADDSSTATNEPAAAETQECASELSEEELAEGVHLTERPLSPGEIVVAPSTVAPGEEIAVSWDLEDPDGLVLGALLSECWNGDEWVPIWVYRDVFSETSVEMVDDPSAGVDMDMVGFRPRDVVLEVPSGVPAGVYRIRGGGYSGLFTIAAE